MTNKKMLLLSGVLTGALVIGGGTYFFLDSKPASTSVAEAKTEEAKKPKESNLIEVQEKKPEVKTEEKPDKVLKARDGNSVVGVPDIRDYSIAVKFKPGKEEEGKRILAELHEFYNNLTGWGDAEHIDWSNLKYAEMQEKIQSFRDTLEPNTSRIENDVNNATVLLGVAYRYEDSMAMRYVHRIFHDLDHHINGTPVDKEWGVTSAFNGNPKEIRNYLLGSGFFAENKK
ncbi:hypothetical protein [Corallococcus sp. AB032C]|uniref:hypothetical protein n=1 Tax=Corallococcus sp. AB032C TaxID=2316717 RepID=UPI0011C372A1|nr:hypothetical protein [Corallococcus sp. AB032C]